MDGEDGDVYFEDVQLDDKDNVSLTPDALHVDPSSALTAFGSHLRTGWRSNMSLVSKPAQIDGPTMNEVERRKRFYHLHSSSTPNLRPERTASTERSYPAIASAAAASTTSLAPTRRQSVPFSDDVPQKRIVEGRYRSRREHPKGGKLRPLLLSSSDLRPPQGVQYDSFLAAGVSMTVTDANGELVVVRSPLRAEHASSTPSTTSFAIPGEPRRSSASIPQAPSPLSQSVSSLGPVAKDDVPPEEPLPETPPHTDTPETPAEAAPAPPAQAILPKANASSNLTRMPHLPPKPRAEEAKHLADFSAMMQAAKQAEKQRVLSSSSERRKRMDEEAQVRPVWDQEILPCWTRAREERKYHDLWWGGIPPSLRGRLWPRACGNNLMLSHNLFAKALAAVQAAQAADQFPASLLNAIKVDMASTLPSLRLFDEQAGPLSQDLTHLLLAYVYVRADEASQREQQSTLDLASLHDLYDLYVPGTAPIAAMLLMNISPPHALIVLMNLIASKSWLKTLHRLERRQSVDSHSRDAIQEQLQGYERVFSSLLAERMPDIYANLHKMGIRPQDYVRPWIQTMFAPWLEIDTVSRLWDIMYVLYVY